MDYHLPIRELPCTLDVAELELAIGLGIGTLTFRQATVLAWVNRQRLEHDLRADAMTTPISKSDLRVTGVSDNAIETALHAAMACRALIFVSRTQTRRGNNQWVNATVYQFGFTYATIDFICRARIKHVGIR